VQLRTDNGGRHKRRRAGGVCHGRIGSVGVVTVVVAGLVAGLVLVLVRLVEGGGG